VIWHRDHKPYLSSYTRIGILGIEVQPVANAWRADLFFWAQRERGGGPNLGFFDTEEDAKEQAPDLARRLLANVEPCACNFVGRCPRHPRTRA